jgi:hypothetical protein
MSNRQRGKNGELYFVNLLKEIFPNCHRNWLSQSAIGGIDIAETPGWSFEVKYGKQCNIKKLEGWIDQLNLEANEGDYKALLIRGLRRKPLVVMEWDDWFTMLKFNELKK